MEAYAEKYQLFQDSVIHGELQLKISNINFLSNYFILKTTQKTIGINGILMMTKIVFFAFVKYLLVPPSLNYLWFISPVIGNPHFTCL